jgi:hypothetical protein
LILVEWPITRHSLWLLILLIGTSTTVRAQAASDVFPVSGLVVDQAGAAVPGAQVMLRGNGVAEEQSTTSDASGAFRFAKVAAGTYEVQVQQQRFKPATTPLSLSTRPPGPLRIVLTVAELQQ